MASEPPTDRRPRTSGLAILAAASSLVFCLPVGAVFGVLALVRIQRSKGALSGRGLAITGLVLSLVLNAGTFFFMSQVYPVLMRNSECFAQQLLVGRELTRIQKLQTQYRRTHQRFGSLPDIGFKPTSQGDVYVYRVLASSKDQFIVQAVADGEGMGGDTWELDQTGMPRNVVSGCIR